MPPAPSGTRWRHGGLYRVVRHPIYASYVFLDASLIWAVPSTRNLVVGALGLALYLVRMQLEERALAGDEYARYVARVRFRLMPFIY